MTPAEQIEIKTLQELKIADVGVRLWTGPRTTDTVITMRQDDYYAVLEYASHLGQLDGAGRYGCEKCLAKLK